MTRLLAAAALTLASVAFAPGAFAQSNAWYRPNQDASASYSPRRAAPVCEKACPYDYSPCDPVEFKLADGRCQNSTHGR